MLPAIELLSDLTPQLFVLNVLEDVNRLYQAAELCQCLGESVGWRGAHQALYDNVCGHYPVLQGSRHPDQRLPLFADYFEVHRALEQRFHCAIVVVAVDLEQPPFVKRLEPGHEGEPQKKTQSEHVIGVAAGIRVMPAGR